MLAVKRKHRALLHTLVMQSTQTIAPPASRQLPLRKLGTHAAISAVFNVALAITLTVFGNESLTTNLLYSQLIGLSIWALIDVGRFMLYPSGWGEIGPMSLLVVTSVIVGYFGGVAVGDMLLGHSPLHAMQLKSKSMAGFLLMSLAAGTAGTFYFMSREKLHSARLEREEAQRQATEAQLQLLQSQLEPHMLFNTLANLRALIATDTARATQMLDHMNDYLRSTLSASRATEHPLSAEFDRLRDYLALMSIRMGSRLRTTLDLPAELAQHKVPPLILQSLVENAIVHGLEPQVAGGEISVSARLEGGQLLLQVRDTGVGFDPAHTPEGFGITQVRERLATRYGDQATINIIAAPAIFQGPGGLKHPQNSPPQGCSVLLRLPLASTLPLAPTQP